MYTTASTKLTTINAFACCVFLHTYPWCWDDNSKLTFLIAGFYSYVTAEGSHYIQTICDVFEKFDELDLFAMMTHVNDRLSQETIKRACDSRAIKQMPNYKSSLTHDIHFTRKRPHIFAAVRYNLWSTVIMIYTWWHVVGLSCTDTFPTKVPELQWSLIISLL